MYISVTELTAGDTNMDNLEEFRSLPGTAMGGVALAFIGMILEFITLSGFHPAVSISTGTMIFLYNR